MKRTCRPDGAFGNRLSRPFQPGSSRRGFTLLELVVVIVVLGLLVTLVAPQILGRVGDAQITAARTQMELFGTALDNYKLDNGMYPSTEQGLAALRAAPTVGVQARNWRGPYLRKDVPPDPWGRPFLYRSPGVRNPTGYDLATLGRDGEAGGTGEDADIIGQ
ncbi:MAG: type II secretion system major pseudopilin GspG [Gemmatimonadota bacterium]